ncbi:VOC family protein [Thauera phenylacetica]|jgi:catechol 2,3-dioxygenase-like lactoylglutathione lyase family enzyme|uniref:Glyoxalase/bleomycin resistance protein/dioxygenase n=1 Tax=Thauera phenylacetica B4P TaxID=1234382 RepID=N6ZS31_9RHOO|nr:VOC family protein [Thauera phenylacetica]ENO97143.1 glyoxalase/bleomycin resistance protein/dioxygenase [Thauera phenylacetica B4P]MBL8464585.1 VOC family protein [Thauera sp.]
MDTLGWQELKVVALAVDDLARAESFYRSRLGLERRLQADGDVGFALGGLTILLKPLSAPGGGAEKSPYPRLTIAVADAPRLARDLAARGVTISDAVQLYDDGYWVGAFLDSEGNKLWFCSEAG